MPSHLTSTPFMMSKKKALSKTDSLLIREFCCFTMMSKMLNFLPPLTIKKCGYFLKLKNKITTVDVDMTVTVLNSSKAQLCTSDFCSCFNQY